MAQSEIFFGAPDALAAALRAALPGLEAAGGVDRLLALADGAVHCTGRAAALARVALGKAHPLTESSSFAAFFAGLPYPVASAIAQGATKLFACK